MGVGCHNLRNHLQDTGQIFKHVVIPESNDTKSIGLNGICTKRILHYIVRVLPTIDFDNDHWFKTSEVCDVWPN